MLNTTKKPTLQSSKKPIFKNILQLKADHGGSKIPFTEFRWIGPYNIEKVLPNKGYLLRKNGTNKTQLLYRMRMCQFTPHQLPDDIQITPQEWKPNPEMSLKHDDLYSRAWDCEYDQPTPRILMQRRPIRAKLQYSLIYQLRKGGTPQEPHTSIPQKFFLKWKN